MTNFDSVLASIGLVWSDRRLTFLLFRRVLNTHRMERAGLTVDSVAKKNSREADRTIFLVTRVFVSVLLSISWGFEPLMEAGVRATRFFLVHDRFSLVLVRMHGQTNQNRDSITFLTPETKRGSLALFPLAPPSTGNQVH